MFMYIAVEKSARKRSAESTNGKRKLTRPPLRHGSQWSEERGDSTRIRTACTACSITLTRGFQIGHATGEQLLEDIDVFDIPAPFVVVSFVTCYIALNINNFTLTDE